MQQHEIETSNRNIVHIFEGIRGGITKRGLRIELSDTNRYGEKTGNDSLRIVITHPTLEFFRVDILGREWNDYNRASLHLATDYTDKKQTGTYPDGSPYLTNERYEFDNHVSYAQFEEIGVEKWEYSYKTYSLQKNFKADKNIKLILKDILPAVDKYIKIVEIAEPSIRQRMSKYADTLALQNKVSAHSTYKNNYTELKDRSFSFDFGNVEISSYGDITLTRKISATELLKLLGTR